GSLPPDPFSSACVVPVERPPDPSVHWPPAGTVVRSTGSGRGARGRGGRCDDGKSAETALGTRGPASWAGGRGRIPAVLQGFPGAAAGRTAVLVERQRSPPVFAWAL